jgi:hypothetical protein
MKLPIYENLLLKTSDKTEIWKLLENINFGEVPVYVELGAIDLSDLYQALEHIAEYLDNFNINPKFPYPIYIVTHFINSHPVFPIIEDLNQLPSFFKKSNKRLINKDILALKKNNTFASRIRNQNIYLNSKAIKTGFQKQRQLLTKSYEAQFYSKIIKEIKSHPQDRNEEEKN